jgi:hypothetical protein
MSTVQTPFLAFFYKVFLYCGAAGIMVSIVGGSQACFSFALGFLSIAVILFAWDLTLRVTLKPRQTTWVKESLLVFLRYILLGALFYGMMRLFVVKWLWYFAGTTMILPGLLISTLLYREEPVDDHQSTNPEEQKD